MTINVKETAAIQEPITTPVDKRCKPVYCIDNGKRWNSATECAEELGVSVLMVYYVCNGKHNTCKGLRLCYRENFAELCEKMATELAAKDTAFATEKELADKWRAHEAQLMAEQEAARKAEENRLQSIEDTKLALAKADEKIARRTRIVERFDEQYQAAVGRLTKAEQEKADLIKKLLELEGHTKSQED